MIRTTSPTSAHAGAEAITLRTGETVATIVNDDGTVTRGRVVAVPATSHIRVGRVVALDSRDLHPSSRRA